MKRIIYLSLVLPLFLFSCKSTPEAHFYTDTIEPEVGQDVFFTNDSHNATKFEWDFGDSFSSNEENPVHYYTATGPYEVTLTAISKNGLEDKATLSLNVMIPTLLEIEVRENNNDEFVVPDASVILFPTLIDWDNESNMVDEGIADAKGIVVFSNLDPIVYYVDAWEQNHDNWTLGTINADWIRTPEVMPNTINRFVAWVDVVNHGKGVEKDKKTIVIKRIESKSFSKWQPASGSSTDNWQELYDKSVGKKSN
ncbi:MAG: PKD domain-containing protein [Bacteroidia bacterium]|nr:PKD domain-containing protein [Bacteroidia bacterium]